MTDLFRPPVERETQPQFCTDLHELSVKPSPCPPAAGFDGNNNLGLERSSSIKRIRNTRRQISTAVCKTSSDLDDEQPDLEHLPPLQFEPPDMRETAFILKLRQCHRICDFNDAKEDVKNKEVKRMALNDIIDYMTVCGPKDKDQFNNSTIYGEIFQLVDVNLFRDLPPMADISPLELILMEDDEPIKDVAWPHLKLVYDFLLRFLTSSFFDKQLGREFLNEQFISKYLKLFESLDSREREMARTVLHRIYCKMINLRPLIRTKISHIILMFVNGDRSFHGISELLELMCSIIAGYAKPIKAEHQTFLFRVLIPLHRPISLPVYHENLTLCILQYIDKDPSLSQQILTKLLPLWPKVHIDSSVKMVNFISEVEQVVSKINISQLINDTENGEAENLAQLPSWLVPLTIKLADCMRSANSLIAERALTFTSDVFILFLKLEPSKLVPHLFPALHQTSRNHWSSSVVALTYELLQQLMHLDRDLFDQLVDQFPKNTNTSTS